MGVAGNYLSSCQFRSITYTRVISALFSCHNKIYHLPRNPGSLLGIVAAQFIGRFVLDESGSLFVIARSAATKESPKLNGKLKLNSLSE
jgi:hypothetical protein